MKTIFLNMKTNQGVETIDEFTKQENQSDKEFRAYISHMVREYHIARMNVYKSTRCTKDWKTKP